MMTNSLLKLVSPECPQCDFYTSFDGLAIAHDSDISLGTKMCDFYEENGFVVISGVFTSEECEDTVAAMWNLLEESNPNFSRGDFKTWDQFKSTGDSL